MQEREREAREKVKEKLINDFLDMIEFNCHKGF